MIKLPKVYFDDHDDCNVPSPAILWITKKHYLVDPADPAIDEFSDRAEYYATGQFEREYFGLVSSARATVKAIKQSRI